MSTHLIPVNSGRIGDRVEPVVAAKKLHGFLEVRTRFNDWFARRLSEYRFTEGEDYARFYSELSKTQEGGRPALDYHLSLDMAKELAMIERTPRGREARQYFIRCERELLAIREGASPLGAEEAPAFNRLDSGLMRELRRTNPRLVQAYLVANGVTPAYVAGLLGSAELPAPARPEREPAPLPVLRERVADCATKTTEHAWLFLRADFEKLCADYDPLETARALRDLGYLQTEHGKLVQKAPRNVLPGRPNVYTVSRSMLEG